MTPKAKLVFAVAAGVVAIGLIAYDNYRNRNIEPILDEAGNEEVTKQLVDLTDVLDKKLEAARYWDIVTRNLD